MSIHVVGFVLAVTPLILTPGLSFTLATQRTLAGQVGASLGAALGTGAGIYVHALLAGLGLVALLERWPPGLRLLRLGGGVYLLWLGLRMLHSAWQKGSGQAVSQVSQPQSPPVSNTRPAHFEAFWGTLLNAKAASVYLLVAPQFVGSGTPTPLALLLLATLHVALMATWLTCWCAFLGRVQRRTALPRLLFWTEGVGGLVLVGLAIRSLTT